MLTIYQALIYINVYRSSYPGNNLSSLTIVIDMRAGPWGVNSKVFLMYKYKTIWPTVTQDEICDVILKSM